MFNSVQTEGVLKLLPTASVANLATQGSPLVPQYQSVGELQKRQAMEQEKPNDDPSQTNPMGAQPIGQPPQQDQGIAGLPTPAPKNPMSLASGGIIPRDEAADLEMVKLAIGGEIKRRMANTKKGLSAVKHFDEGGDTGFSQYGDSVFMGEGGGDSDWATLQQNFTPAERRRREVAKLHAMQSLAQVDENAFGPEAGIPAILGGANALKGKPDFAPPAAVVPTPDLAAQLAAQPQPREIPRITPEQIAADQAQEAEALRGFNARTPTFGPSAIPTSDPSLRRGIQLDNSGNSYLDIQGGTLSPKLQAALQADLLARKQTAAAGLAKDLYAEAPSAPADASHEMSPVTDWQQALKNAGAPTPNGIARLSAMEQFKPMSDEERIAHAQKMYGAWDNLTGYSKSIADQKARIQGLRDAKADPFDEASLSAMASLAQGVDAKGNPIGIAGRLSNAFGAGIGQFQKTGATNRDYELKLGAEELAVAKQDAAMKGQIINGILADDRLDEKTKKDYAMQADKMTHDDLQAMMAMQKEHLKQQATEYVQGKLDERQQNNFKQQLALLDVRSRNEVALKLMGDAVAINSKNPLYGIMTAEQKKAEDQRVAQETLATFGMISNGGVAPTAVTAGASTPTISNIRVVPKG